MDEWIDRYLVRLRDARGASEHTLQAYGGDLADFAAFCDDRGIDHPTQIKPRALRAWLARLEDAELAGSTVQRKLSSVRGFLKWLVQEDVLEASPALGLRRRRTARTLPGVLSEKEISALLDSPDTSTHQGLRDRALLELMYSAGTRASETVGLDQDDLDLGGGTARVLGKGGKERLVALGSFAISALEAYLADPERPQPRAEAPGRRSGPQGQDPRGGRARFRRQPRSFG